jgi:hypothetical protein
MRLRGSLTSFATGAPASVVNLERLGRSARDVLNVVHPYPPQDRLQTRSGLVVRSFISDAQEHLGAMLRNTLLGLPPLGKCRATDWLLHRSPKANGAAIGRPPCLAVPRLERRNRGSVCQPEAVKANPNLGLCLSYRPSRGHRCD